VPELRAGHGAVIHAEIWPSLIDVPAVTGQVRDQTQVMCLARELRHRDRADALADWGWSPSDEATVAAQMELLGRYSAWFNRFLLLFPHPTPDVQSKIKEVDDFIRRWVARDGTFDHSIPQTIQEAKAVAERRLAAFEELIGLAARQGDTALRVVPDTNALLRNPAVEDYAPVIGAASYMVHIVTAVLAELDDLKDRGRTPDVRDKAEKVIRRLKGLRDRGSLAEGVTVAGKVRLRLEHREVDTRSVLPWLDPSVPDDRITAAALRLQSDHPAGVVVLVTTDINLQNKADAVGLPYVEPPLPATSRPPSAGKPSPSA
jgi:rRNA-processing protein FCF1